MLRVARSCTTGRRSADEAPLLAPRCQAAAMAAPAQPRATAAKAPRAVVPETAITVERACGRNRPRDPGSPGGGSNRLPSWGSAGSPVVCPSHARRAIMPSRKPGATIVPRIAWTVGLRPKAPAGHPSRPARSLPQPRRAHGSAERAAAAWRGDCGPIELRRIDRRELHHREPNPAALVLQFAAQGVRESTDGELRSAVRRLQRNRPVAQGRADLEDRALVSTPHVAQGRERAVNLSEIGDLRNPPHFRGSQTGSRREDRRHRVVDPNVDSSPVGHHLRRRRFDGFGIGYVGRDRQRLPARDSPPRLRSPDADVRARGARRASPCARTQPRWRGRFPPRPRSPPRPERPRRPALRHAAPARFSDVIGRSRAQRVSCDDTPAAFTPARKQRFLATHRAGEAVGTPRPRAAHLQPDDAAKVPSPPLGFAVPRKSSGSRPPAALSRMARSEIHRGRSGVAAVTRIRVEPRRTRGPFEAVMRIRAPEHLECANRGPRSCDARLRYRLDPVGARHRVRRSASRRRGS